MKQGKAKEATKSFRELIEWELSREQRPVSHKQVGKHTSFGSAIRKKFNDVVEPLEGALQGSAGWGEPKSA